jgi:hypothetical protein
MAYYGEALGSNIKEVHPADCWRRSSIDTEQQGDGLLT